MAGVLRVGVVTLASCVLWALPAVALGLSDHRVYEMVSPPYKGGYGANAVEAVSPNGDGVAFASLGAFGGAPSSTGLDEYVAHREPTGWTSRPIVPPATIAPEGFVADFSPSLETTLFVTLPGPNAGAGRYESTEAEFLRHNVNAPETAAGWEVAGFPLKTLSNEHFTPGYVGASRDLGHIVLQPQPTRWLLSEAEDTVSNLYDLVTSGHGSPELRLVGLNDNGEVIDPYCSPALGAPSGRLSRFNAISTDGSEIFFTANTNLADVNNCDATIPGETVPGNPAILFIRLDGSKTLEISAPLASECVVTAPCHSAPEARAEFVGADEAGTRVYFTTSQPLVSEDTDSGPDLYMAKIECPGGGTDCEPSQREVSSLTLVSRDPNAEQAADVQGDVATAADGDMIYFVARGALTGANDEGNPPTDGADNLYAYNSVADSLAFVGQLCSGAAVSGDVETSRCPLTLTSGFGGRNDSPLWLDNTTEVQTTPDGDYLLFASFGRLVAGDADAAKDVYRYDAALGKLSRISVGEEGFDSNGNADNFAATIPLVNVQEGFSFKQTDMGTRAITDDGRRVVFTTAEPLSQRAVNGLANVYEWEEGDADEGDVSIVSTGSSIEPVTDIVTTPSGDDLFFATSQGLLPQDSDGTLDIYDARKDGGFPPAPSERQPCSGDACQGPLSVPAPVLVPGSVSQVPGGNYEEQPPPRPTKTTAKKMLHDKKSNAKHSKRTALGKKRTKGKTKADAKSGRSSAAGSQVRRGGR